MKKINFSFEELQIIPSEIEELMGFEPEQSPDPFPELIDHGLKLAPNHSEITGGYRIFNNVLVNTQKETIQIENQLFFPGKTVVTQLKNATQAALFLCTAGPGISDLARLKAAEGDEMMAYVIDVIGSLITDKAAFKIQEKIFAEITTAGLNITDSFSPGYCNWSVAEQQKLFALLPAGFCGISLSESSLMNPIKSVSGITGIGKHCEQKGYQCNWCTDRNCIYGKIRRRKNVKKNL